MKKTALFSVVFLAICFLGCENDPYYNVPKGQLEWRVLRQTIGEVRQDPDNVLRNKTVWVTRYYPQFKRNGEWTFVELTDPVVDLMGPAKIYCTDSVSAATYGERF